MAGKLPQIHEGRDGVRQLIKLANQLRLQVPAPTKSLIPTGPINLLATAQTELLPANASGWVTTAVHLIPITITGVQSAGADIQIGTDAGGFANIVPVTGLGAALVVDQVEPLALVTPLTVQADPISFEVSTPATGPSVLTVMVYLEGFFG